MDRYEAIANLVAITQRILDDSTAATAPSFDAASWVARWIELPQPGLAGKKPIELLDTEAGFESVAKLLGAIASGVFV